MKAQVIEDRIGEICTHFLFYYKGHNCGVDPFSDEDFDMWCGDDYMKAHSLEEVMSTPFFAGKCLRDIAEKIRIDCF